MQLESVVQIVNAAQVEGVAAAFVENAESGAHFAVHAAEEKPEVSAAGSFCLLVEAVENAVETFLAQKNLQV